jgi:serine/threonine-protein kinase
MPVRTNLGVGTRLASYTISSVLGRGATGVVYEAQDSRLERRVALKVLAPSLGESERFRERFLHESRLAASIDHPNVIPIYEADEADGLLYIAMRLVAGTDLRGLLAREGRLPPERAIDLVGQAASALDAAHGADLLHRDVKPGNILLAAGETTGEHVYLSDFGLAVSGAADGVLDEGTFQGTAEYAAPEQIEGRLEARSDVYSLACVLYECLAGEPPFGRRRPLATLWAHLNEPPPPLSGRVPGCPPQVDAVLAAALAKSPAERPLTCGELVASVRGAFGLGPNALSTRRRLALAVGVPALVAVTALSLAAATGVLPGSTGDAKAEGSVISTLAGTGTRGFAGDGGPAARARLAEPLSVAVDATGNVYVGDAGSARIRRIGREGRIRTVAGNGGYGSSGDGGAAVDSEIDTPIDLAVGPEGSLYILQHDHPALRRVDRRGVITTVVGTGQVGLLADGVRTVSLNLCGAPVDFAFGPDGAAYVVCSNANRVVRADPDGTFTTVAGSRERGYGGDGGPAVEAALNVPAGIGFDSVGNLYIADSANHRVRKVDRAGIITTFAGTGNAGISGDGFRASFVDLWTPVGVEVDAEDNVYILENGVSRIRKVDRNGIMTTVAGTGRSGFSGDGGPAADAELGSPVSFAIDRQGNIFIADRNNHRVRKVTVDGDTERD